jgi:TP901 family phage tail tape measure protein
MAGNLQVSFVVRLIDRMTAPMRRVTNNFAAMSEAKRKADERFAQAGAMRQTAEGVSRFARVARAAVAAPITAFEDFQAAMSGVRAVSGNLSDDAFVKLTTRAKELGATTRFTATQAAEGFRFFAIAGYNAEQQLAALPAAMDLSTASGTDLGRTADILSDIMGAFGKEAEDARNVSDQLATTLTSSNVTMETMFETMKLVGPVATDFGYSMADMAAMTGFMGSAGIKGSLAGTALRSAMLKMADPTSKARAGLKHFGIAVDDGTGNMRQMVDILSDVADKTKTMGTRQRATFLKELFGLRAISGMSKLLAQGGDAIREFSARIENSSGAVAEMARISDDNAKGATTRLLSALDGLAVEVGEQLEPALTSLKNTLTEVIQSVTSWAIEHPTLTKVLGGSAAIVAALSSALTGLIFSMVALKAASGVAAYGIGGFKTALQLLSGALEATMLRMEAATAATQVLSFETMPAKKGIFGMTKEILKAIPAFIGLKFSAWGAAIGINAALWPVLAIAAAITLIVAGVYLAIRYWDKITAAVERFKNASMRTKIILGLLLAPVIAVLSPVLALAYLAVKLKKYWEPIKVFFSELWDSITTGVKELVGWLKKIELPAPLRAILDAHLEAGGMAAQAASFVGGQAKEFAAETKYIATGDRTITERAAPEKTARLEVKVDSEGNASIRKAEAEGFDLDIESWYNGPAMATS